MLQSDDEEDVLPCVGHYHANLRANSVFGSAVLRWGAMRGDSTEMLAALVEQCEADLASVVEVRSRGDELADEIGGDLALRWRIAVVRAVIADPPDGDAVREVYGELVDRYRDEPARLAQLRTLGDEIRRLEAEGALPSAMVARSDRRKKT